MPIGRKESSQPAEQILFDAKFSASNANLESQPGRAFRTIYTLAGIALLANVGALAWAYADRLPGIGTAAQEFEGKLRLGDLRQTSTSDFAAQLDGTFAWKRGSLDIRAESLRVRAWDCEGACPKIQEISLVLWHFGEDEQGGVGGVGVARSEPITIDKVPQNGSVLDLGAKSFSLRFPKNPDPRQTSLRLEVKTDKREYEYGQRFGGASHLFGLVQAAGEADTCAKVKDAMAALEHFCHVRFSEMMSGLTAAQRQRLLFLAVGRGNLDAVKSLLAAEVKVDSVNSYGYTPLMVAVFGDQPEIAAELIEAGANLNFAAKSDSEYGSDSPLGAALTAGAVRSAQVLIDKGADLKGTHGRSPMVHVAVAADLPELIPLLVKKGADVDARAGWGNQPTPLMAAAGVGNLQAVNRLLELGADPAAGDSNGNTARDYAARTRARRARAAERIPGKCALTGADLVGARRALRSDPRSESSLWRTATAPSPERASGWCARGDLSTSSPTMSCISAYLRADTKRASLLRLFAGELPATAAERKARKPDLEALCCSRFAGYSALGAACPRFRLEAQSLQGALLALDAQGRSR
jgi:hypothetical protein